MTNEEFDEAIRKKFENESMPYTQDEVKRVINYVERKQGIRKRIKYSAILIGVVLISGLIYWIIK